MLSVSTGGANTPKTASPNGPRAQSLNTDDVDDLVGELQATVADNTLANFAIGFLVTLIVLFLAVLVGGEFINSVEMSNDENVTSNPNPLAEVGEDMEGHVITAFTIFGVTLLVIPAVAAIVLIRGGFSMGDLGGR